MEEEKEKECPEVAALDVIPEAAKTVDPEKVKAGVVEKDQDARKIIVQDSYYSFGSYGRK